MGSQDKPKRFDALKVSLAVLVIALIAVSGYLYYQNAQLGSQLSALQASKDSLQSSYDNLQASYNNLTTSYDNLRATRNATVASYLALQYAYENLLDIVNLLVSRTVVVNGTTMSSHTFSQSANTYTSFALNNTVNDIHYAGYLRVVVSSNSPTTYAEIHYSYGGIYGGTTWSLRQTIGRGGSEIFPVLPADDIEVRIGNTEPSGVVSQTVSITYQY